jgi:hypothetical protein
MGGPVIQTGPEKQEDTGGSHFSGAGTAGHIRAIIALGPHREGRGMTTQQPNLFGFGAGHGAYHEPLPARAGDPVTSHEAAARHRSSGRLGRNAAAVLALVREHPGHTYRELWDLCSPQVRELLGSEVELMRRLGSLKARGAVAHGEQRTCRIKGTRMVTWIAL